MKRLFACSAIAWAVAAEAVPSAEIKSFGQSSDRSVTVEYVLGEDAVVTLSMQAKESGEWRTLDDSMLVCVSGDVNREVAATSGDEVRKIVWHPDYVKCALEAATLRPVVKVWPKDDPPDYMVVDLAEVSAARVRYYTSTNALPGGLFGNPDYRTTKLVLRKIPAKGVTWRMGSEAESGRDTGAGKGNGAETLHDVSFGSNYYMAVFETTEFQWFAVKGNGGLGSSFASVKERNLLPLNGVSYCDVREGAKNTPNTAHEYPNAPHPDSFLGILRSRTGLDGFDLPSTAEWEYACRAGNGENRWGNGAEYVYSTWENDPLVPGRYQFNQPDSSSMTPAPVGSHSPNMWGIYDMHGNVFEWCVDWYTHDITGLAGKINTENGLTAAYQSVAAKCRDRRGGAYNLPVAWLRSANRCPEPGNSRGGQNGFRVKFGAAIAR